MYTHTRSADNLGYEKYGGLVEKITAVVPSARQYRLSEMKYYNFIHFGMNTMLDLEWSDGTAPTSLFNPKKLDTDQWCSILKESGSSGIIITAKHHDGFCLWDTKTTDYNVMNSPFGKDIVGMLSESCKKYGMRLGIYLSPWDRHEKTYGTDAYNDFYIAQLTELAENYGDIFCFWLDGACGEGANGKKQEYDFDRYFKEIRRMQPMACISICGPDIRWIGNEGGMTRKSEWSVVPTAAVTTEKTMNSSQKTDDGGASVLKISASDEDLGSREFLQNFDSFVWSPAECDVSVNLGWFWHDDGYYAGKKMRTGADIAQIYMKTVGGNALLLLNVPPDRDGLINPREQEILRVFKKMIQSKFRYKITPAEIYLKPTVGPMHRADGLSDGQTQRFRILDHAVVIKLGEAKKISMITLEEDIHFSQRIENFEIFAKIEGQYLKISEGTTVGTGKFCEFSVKTDEIIINILRSRGTPAIRKIGVYGKNT